MLFSAGGKILLDQGVVKLEQGPWSMAQPGEKLLKKKNHKVKATEADGAAWSGRGFLDKTHLSYDQCSEHLE